MTNNDNDVVKQAADYWIEGEAMEAGKLLFQRLSNDLRPRWAARILRLVLEKAGIQSPLFAKVLYDADHQRLWGDGHRAFSTLRDSTLKLDEVRRTRGLTEGQDTLACVLALAELVAKVTYNAANPPDEFDEDSGWWIVSSLKAFTNH